MTKSCDGATCVEDTEVDALAVTRLRLGGGGDSDGEAKEDADA